MRAPWKTLTNGKTKSSCVEMSQDACESSQRAPQKRQRCTDPCHTHRIGPRLRAVGVLAAWTGPEPRLGPLLRHRGLYGCWDEEPGQHRPPVC